MFNNMTLLDFNLPEDRYHVSPQHMSGMFRTHWIFVEFKNEWVKDRGKKEDAHFKESFFKTLKITQHLIITFLFYEITKKYTTQFAEVMIYKLRDSTNYYLWFLTF